VLLIAVTCSAKATTIYSGTCNCIRRTWVQENKESDAVIFTKFVKIIVDRSTHKFTLYFNGEQVFSGPITLDTKNNNEGVEDFVVNGGIQSGRLYVAEKAFYVDIPKRKSDNNDVLGYRFELQNFKLDEM